MSHIASLPKRETQNLSTEPNRLHRRLHPFSLTLCALLLFLAAPSQSQLLAHNPDTSYARLSIGSQKLELKLTFDLLTLGKIAPLDDNQDHRVTRQELEQHLPQIQDFLSKSIELHVADLPSGLGILSGFEWPKDTEDGIAEKDFHSAASLISFRFERTVEDIPPDVTLNFRTFKRFGDRHSVLGKFVYAGSETEVSFNQFEPDFLFDTGYQPPLLNRLLKFFRLGVEHILFGFDHLCFLLALLLTAKFRDMVNVISSFTVAHSITLLLSALNVVSLPSRWVESAVALTIVYVALENILRKSHPNRWILTFCFGLIHGFAFAAVLHNLDLHANGLVRCLLSFNVGVELGQIGLVLIALPILIPILRSQYGPQAIHALSIALLGLGSIWFLDRSLALGWMPF